MISEKTSYVIDRVLHWLSSALILAMLLLMGGQIHNIDYQIKGAVAHKQGAIEVHFIMGAFVLILLVARLFWSKFYLPESRKPVFSSTKHKYFVYATHCLMYLVLFSLIFTGLLMVNNYEHPLSILGLLSLSQGASTLSLFNWANEMHLFLQGTIYYLIAIHLAGAMYSRR